MTFLERSFSGVIVEAVCMVGNVQRFSESVFPHLVQIPHGREVDHA